LPGLCRSGRGCTRVVTRNHRTPIRDDAGRAQALPFDVSAGTSGRSKPIGADEPAPDGARTTAPLTRSADATGRTMTEPDHPAKINPAKALRTGVDRATR